MADFLKKMAQALKQYAADAIPGGSLNPETQPVADRAKYMAGALDPNSQISGDLQGWHKKTQAGLTDQLAGKETPEAEYAYQQMMNIAGVAPIGSTYARRSQSPDTPFNDVNYAMFTEIKNGLRNTLDALSNYGPGMWGATDKAAVPIKTIQADIVRAIRNSGSHADYQTTAANLARDANPKNIVDSAGLWDNPELSNLVYEKVISPNGIRAIKTNDGLIVFDGKIAKKVGR